MDILRMMLVDRLSRGDVKIVLDRETVEQINWDCFSALSRIRALLADNSMDDPECFERIERIVCEMESLGLDCGGRHDYG